MITRVRKIGASLRLMEPTLRIIRRAGTTAESRSDISGGRARVERISPERRHEMIAEAAYFRAERRGFAPGAESADWLESEAEIEELLAAG
ncbi:MAG TPA: DUF2934 domain-containing protein [Burkholderiales bacterium]|nr:DUF2934 domain-containing protein [Burkholderiales bacterium]